MKALYRAAVRFGGGSYGKNTARLGCKIPAAVCGPKIRDEYFVNATLRVILSLDPETDEQPQLDGMNDAFASHEITVKVNQYGLNDSDVGFGMTFGKTDMPAEFLQSISHSPGSLYILSVQANEDGKTTEAEEAESEESDDDEDSEE